MESNGANVVKHTIGFCTRLAYLTWCITCNLMAKQKLSAGQYGDVSETGYVVKLVMQIRQHALLQGSL
ncbi:hypothetical protein KY290_030906 [Solanum tuberosum]|uniref:Uncharacterized protein n=1 Tax=Solanum tuberosum TaxID=4113 RepID=A0ABQ7U8X1_SOLTU|nr:hypothetical protein KY285_029986 [Solanum tuberosum]KAH0742913.1 hypothetical protein KY290_030906 [Solanum tuberosum]